MKRTAAIILLFTGIAFSVCQAEQSSKSDTAAQKVLSLNIGTVSFGMPPSKIVANLSSEGYKVTKEAAANSRGIKYWQLQKSTSSRDRYKVKLSATESAAKSLEYSFVSGPPNGFDKDSEHARLTKHFGNDPCEKARRMFRCYFPDGKRNSKLLVKATMDARMYSLEFVDKR